jgi:DNA-directed RNA polymerase subunit alpha
LSQLVKPKIVNPESKGNYAKFVAEPLERGFGVTLGNALRRVLLGYLTGAAVKRLKIEGIQHEFSPIPGVKEDTMEFLLNVKAIRLKPQSGQPGKLVLEKQGPGLITAADINPSTDFEIVNPEQHLATIDSDTRLQVEFDVELGTGYHQADENEPITPGFIAVDAIFAPVRKVNYTVVPTHIGRETNYDKLTLEIWTDGTISAVNALSQSAEMLQDQLAPFTELVATAPAQAIVPAADTTIPDEKYNMSVEHLDLSVRTMNCLRHAGITTVGEILTRGEKELMLLRNFGQKSKQEIEDRLEKIGLTLKPEGVSQATEVKAE